MKTYQPGDTVRLNSATGIIERVVIHDHGNVVEVCRLETYEAAKAAGVKPHGAGFKKADIVETCPRPEEE